MTDSINNGSFPGVPDQMIGSTNQNNPIVPPITGSQSDQNQSEKLYLGKFNADQLAEEVRKRDASLSKKHEEVVAAQKKADTIMQITQSLIKEDIGSIDSMYNSDKSSVNEYFMKNYGYTYDSVVEKREQEKHKENPGQYEIEKKMKALEEQNNLLMRNQEESYINQYSINKSIPKDKLMEFMNNLNPQLPLNQKMDIAANMYNASNGGQNNQNNYNPYQQPVSQQFNPSVTGMPQDFQGGFQQQKAQVQLTPEEYRIMKQFGGITPEEMVAHREENMSDESLERRIRMNGVRFDDGGKLPM